METDWKKRTQVVIIILLILAGLRLGFILYERHEANKPAAPAQPAYSSNWDEYVTPKKIFPYDLKSAREELAGKTVWVRSGNQVSYYKYNPATHAADLKHPAGMLGPLEKLDVKDAVIQKAPASIGNGQLSVVQKQIFVVFQKPGDNGAYAAPVATETGENFTFNLNDLFFFEDPHQLYKHWPADVWNAIDHHEVKQGMNELQAGFAVGTNAQVSSGDLGNRTVEYANAGKPVTVTFEGNKAVQVLQGKSQ